ncbi:YolD-like family protein [Siminovitchia sediminis]|uniref:YolD-like family protein n=1 Tax=Siminovitchia sediminis TaxID=1274353 RepID=A0ABW4KLN8_9BACI
MDIKDRGTKKWTAMMLPEHVKMLKELKVDYELVIKPQLDEQGWEQINETLYIAIEYNLSIIFTLWIDGFLKKIEGAVHFIDEINKLVHVVDIRGDVHKIRFDVITEVEYKN